MGAGKTLKEALQIVVEQKLLGTYQIAVMEISNPQSLFFVKNSGELILAHNKTNDEIVVCNDPKLFSVSLAGQNLTQIEIPINQILEVTKDCKFTFQQLQKQITIERNPKATYDHIIQEEIYESIDSVDKATDFGGKFISPHQVFLGGFEKSKDSLETVEDLLIQGVGTSYIAAQYGAFVMRELDIFNLIRVVTPEELRPLELASIKYGGFLTVTANGSHKNLLHQIKQAYKNNLTCFNIVNVENSPITRIIDELCRETNEEEKKAAMDKWFSTELAEWFTKLEAAIAVTSKVSNLSLTLDPNPLQASGQQKH